MLLYFSNIGFISTSYAQIFEFDEGDYYESKEKEKNTPPTTNSKDTATTTNLKDIENKPSPSATSEDTDKETCIDGPIEQAAVLSSPSNNDMNSDSYYSSNFHFVKKFDKNGTLVDSWGKVRFKDGQFLHAHGITIDSKDNVYISDAENYNIQKFDKYGNFITKWGSTGIGPGEFMQPESMAVDSLNNIYVTGYSGKNIQKFDSEGNFIIMWGYSWV